MLRNNSQLQLTDLSKLKQSVTNHVQTAKRSVFPTTINSQQKVKILVNGLDISKIMIPTQPVPLKKKLGSLLSSAEYLIRLARCSALFA